MDMQSKLLDQNYLKTRLEELKEIKKGDVKYNIYESDRLFSKTIYIDFYIQGKDKWYKQYSIRISDHEIKCLQEQFIIDRNLTLTKGVKDKFMQLVKKTINRSKNRCFYIEMDKVSNEVQNNE